MDSLNCHGLQILQSCSEDPFHVKGLWKKKDVAKKSANDGRPPVLHVFMPSRRLVTATQRR